MIYSATVSMINLCRDSTGTLRVFIHILLFLNSSKASCCQAAQLSAPWVPPGKTRLQIPLWGGVTRNQTSTLGQLTFIFSEADLAAERVDLLTSSVSSGSWGGTETWLKDTLHGLSSLSLSLTESGYLQMWLSLDPVELNGRLDGSMLWPWNY